MYNVKNTIVKCTHLRLLDNFKDERIIPLKECKFYNGKKNDKTHFETLHFGTDEKFDEGYYDNGVLEVPDLGDLYILQDYGDLEVRPLDGFIDFPRELVFGYGSDISIGLMDGRCCVIYPNGSELIVNKLKGPFIESIDWEMLYWKRPFSTCIMIDADYEMDSNVYFLVEIRMGEKHWSGSFILPFKYKDIFSPNRVADCLNECYLANISNGVEVKPYNGLTCWDEKKEKYFITNDYLIYRGFLLRDNDGEREWYKGDVIIKMPDPGYYSIGKGDEEKYIWYTDEVDELLCKKE